MKRVLLVEWLDAINVDARLAVRDEDSTKALLVYITVDLSTGLMGDPTIWRCTADASGERCRVLGGLSTHADVTADYLSGAFEAYGPNSDQEALFQYLEGAL